MRLICQKRCCIGEGPIWNPLEERLYFTNGMTKEICRADLSTGEITELTLERGVAAIAFDRQGRMIVSRADGVFFLEDNIATPLYDSSKHAILHANDMKVGPDGRIYVGTQSQARLKLSDAVDGGLYSIDGSGHVRQLLGGLRLSNGLDWSMDESRFYHTDSDTNTVREYAFDKTTGEIEYTGRSVFVKGVDGFTIDENDRLYVACWGQGHVAVVDTRTMRVTEQLAVPAKKPASCAFCGKDLQTLAVVTASYNCNLQEDPNAGGVFLHPMSTRGRAPYLFASNGI